MHEKTCHHNENVLSGQTCLPQSPFFKIRTFCKGFIFSSCEILSICIYEFEFLLCSEMLATLYGVVMIK